MTGGGQPQFNGNALKVLRHVVDEEHFASSMNSPHSSLRGGAGRSMVLLMVSRREVQCLKIALVVQLPLSGDDKQRESWLTA